MVRNGALLGDKGLLKTEAMYLLNIVWISAYKTTRLHKIDTEILGLVNFSGQEELKEL
jgi:hypothetical protein